MFKWIFIVTLMFLVALLFVGLWEINREIQFDKFRHAYEATPQSVRWDSKVDFDKDGIVTILDYSILYAGKYRR